MGDELAAFVERLAPARGSAPLGGDVAVDVGVAPVFSIAVRWPGVGVKLRPVAAGCGEGVNVGGGVAVVVVIVAVIPSGATEVGVNAGGVDTGPVVGTGVEVPRVAIGLTGVAALVGDGEVTVGNGLVTTAVGVNAPVDGVGVAVSAGMVGVNVAVDVTMVDTTAGGAGVGVAVEGASVWVGTSVGTGVGLSVGAAVGVGASAAGGVVGAAVRDGTTVGVSIASWCCPAVPVGVGESMTPTGAPPVGDPAGVADCGGPEGGRAGAAGVSVPASVVTIEAITRRRFRGGEGVGSGADVVSRGAPDLDVADGVGGITTDVVEAAVLGIEGTSVPGGEDGL